MAKFSQQTLNMVAGTDGQILAENLVYNQKDFWNFAWADTTTTSGWTTSSGPIDLSGVTIDAQIVRRAISNFNDSRTGLNFKIQDYPAIPLIQTITATSAVDNMMTCTSTAELYLDQPVQFAGTVFGGVAINTTYYVKEIPTATTFSISATSSGATLVLSTATGSMSMNKIDPTPVSLAITNRVDADGTFTMTIDDATWGVITGDPDLDINAIEPACFSGRLKLSFPAVVIGATTQPAYDQIVFLLFLINSDGVVNY
tara:strand:+ start:82 stop:852 length:771 start_codon:yes stop_codon:yes gene_type:complete